ncbi:MAG: pyridoxal phosphate-dependent aminotransferase [Gammaproteobacteria bacterium]|nr:pyridoxal phosphate-dependent aminotransferase [Gammaproteobacteria bacterium]MBV9724505.1 pyridoxal phosphate-dependent aminotransferase [Gammaproteobacteria bacterium]
MRFSALVDRVRGEGASAWRTHYEAVAAQERGEDVIILSVGDPDLDTPAPVIERAIAQLRAGDTHYVPAAGRLALRQAIARAHTQRSGQLVGPENVVYLAGAQSALFVSSLCLAGPGDEVVTFEPLYPTYPATIEISGARLVQVPASAQCRPDVAALEQLIGPHTRAILWASPNNPSGVVLNDAELAVIAHLAQRHDLWLIADEVYAGLAAGGRVPSLAAQLPDRVVTLGSLSKSHAMTGWRAGWLVGPRELVLHAENVAMCMLFGLPGFIQEAAITALEVAAEAEARSRAYCTARQARFAAGIAGTPGLRPLAPEAGMFMLIDVTGTGLSGAEFVQALYRTQRVSVMDGGAFGSSAAGCVRVCFATDEATLDRACARLRQFCEEGRS